MQKILYGFVCLLTTGLIAACGMPITPLSQIHLLAYDEDASNNSIYAMPEPTHLDCCSLPDREIEHETYQLDSTEKAYYLDNQIVLMGLEPEIEAVLTEYNQTVGARSQIQIDPEPRMSTKVSFLSGAEREQSFVEEVETPFSPANAELVINLYTLSENSHVGNVIADIYQVSKGLTADQSRTDVQFGVFADPNYLIGRSNTALTASPGCPELSSVNIPAIAAEELFWDQWAFNIDDGIALVSEGERHITETGAGVRVGIFDTSPFTTTGGYLFEGSGWITPSLEVHVSHPSLPNVLSLPEDEYDMRDHGLYVAGLVHAVAPDSEIHLIRALDEHGRGDLAGLIEAISLFAEQTVLERGSLENTVLNFSLGMNPPTNLDRANLPTNLVTLINDLALEGGSSYRTPISNEVPILALETLLASLHNAGAVIVASTGNASTHEMIESSDLPADYPFVIGVSGNNIDRNRSCFANAGDITGPAGDNNAENCNISLVESCSEDNLDACLVSYTLHEHQGYAYWVGTSFSAPLVTGEAALILEANSPTTPANVRAIMEGDVCYTGDPDHGVGMINLSDTGRVCSVNVLNNQTFLPLIDR